MRVFALLINLLAIFPTGLAQETFQLPDYGKFKLKNGLTVYMMVQKEVPLINFSLMVPAGSAYDRQEKLGLAEATADGLMLGTENYDKLTLAESIEFTGAEVSTSVGKDAAYLQAVFMKSDQEKIFGLIREILLKPVFPEEEWTKIRDLKMDQLDQQKESPRSVISFYFDGFAYQDHPYAFPQPGTKNTLEKITRNDLVQFYQEHYVPDGSALAIVGDFDPAAMKKQVTGMFSGWQGKGKPVAYGKPSILQNNQVLLVDKPDALETTFLIGGPGVARDNPDYVAIQVVNTILGGRFTSWLNDELRVNSGLTYGARSYFDVEKQAGLFKMSTFTQTANTEKAIDLALKVYRRLLEEGIDQETLESAKNYVKGQLPPDYERGRSLANYLTGMHLYGYDAGYLNSFVSKVNDLDLPKAKEIIKTYFPAQNELVLVMIGKAEALRDLAGKYGEVTEKPISAEGF